MSSACTRNQLSSSSQAPRLHVTLPCAPTHVQRQLPTCSSESGRFPSPRGRGHEVGTCFTGEKTGVQLPCRGAEPDLCLLAAHPLGPGLDGPEGVFAAYMWARLLIITASYLGESSEDRVLLWGRWVLGRVGSQHLCAHRWLSLCCGSPVAAVETIVRGGGPCAWPRDLPGGGSWVLGAHPRVAKGKEGWGVGWGPSLQLQLLHPKGPSGDSLWDWARRVILVLHTTRGSLLPSFPCVRRIKGCKTHCRQILLNIYFEMPPLSQEVAQIVLRSGMPSPGVPSVSGASEPGK